MRLVAIGDSFFYISSHLEETSFRLKKGLFTYLQEKLSFPLEVENLGINGANTSTFADMPFPKGDSYLLLLGTNDWWGNYLPTGTKEDYLLAKDGSILGNFGKIISHIRKASPNAPIFALNPVERSDFVYVFDHNNNAKGSYYCQGGRYLKDIAKAIYETVRGENIYPINLHEESGFNVENCVKFKRLRVNGILKDIPYPEYENLPYDPKDPAYPYPVEAIENTYDGLHPSDQGMERIAQVIAKHMNEVIFDLATSSSQNE